MVVVNHRDVVVVALQNLDEQNQDEVLPYFHRAENLDAAVHRLHLAVLVDVDHRKFQMDYFQDALVMQQFVDMILFGLVQELPVAAPPSGRPAQPVKLVKPSRTAPA